MTFEEEQNYYQEEAEYSRLKDEEYELYLNRQNDKN